MVISLNNKKIVFLAEKVLSKYKLCDHCLGRLFASMERGITNVDRGRKLRKNMVDYKNIKIKNCWLCLGLFDEIKNFADLILDCLKEYEFDTFLVG